MTEAFGPSSGDASALTASWDTARELLKPFGPCAVNFTEAIRLLSAAHTESTLLSAGGRHHILRLLKSDTVKAVYYFCIKQFNPSLLQPKTNSTTQGAHLTPDDCLDAFTPIDHAALLTLCYLFKKLSKRTVKEEWDYVQTPLYEALAIGGHIGRAVPQVGFGPGLLTRGLRYLAFAPLMRENRKAFKEYRRHLKAKDTPFDLEFEKSVWQCTTVHLTGFMLEQMGYSHVAAVQYVAAIERTTSITADLSFGGPFRLAEFLIGAYMDGHDIPTTTPAWTGQEVTVPADVRGNLLVALQQASNESKRIEWLNKNSFDLNPTDTPELFSTQAPVNEQNP